MTAPAGQTLAHCPHCGGPVADPLADCPDTVCQQIDALIAEMFQPGAELAAIAPAGAR